MLGRDAEFVVFNPDLTLVEAYVGGNSVGNVFAEVGSHPILGDKVFANVMAPTTRPEAEAHYETHQRYHDLQIDVEGREAFKVATGSLTLVQEFDEKDDYDLVDSDASIVGDLADDKFALFVAGEPHMPTLEFPGDGAQPVKKICFKLLADAYWEE